MEASINADVPQSGVHRMPLPKWNWMTGRSIGQMPNCPRCDRPSLVMVSPAYARCGICYLYVEKSGECDASGT